MREKRPRKYRQSKLVISLSRKTNEKRKEKVHQNRLSLGMDTLLRGPRESSTTFNVHRSTAEYWKKKVLDPSFHPQQPGGAR